MINVFSIKTGLRLSVDDLNYLAPLPGYDRVKDLILGRFKELPAHFKECMAMPQTQPYMHGDTTDVQYRKRVRGEVFNDPIPVPCEVTINSCKRDMGVLVLGAGCAMGIDEPFPWIDLKYRVSLDFLKSLPNDTKLLIYTRSDLVAHDNYIAELKRLDVSVTILCVSEDEDKTRQLEPGAPSYKRRVIAVNRLNHLGISASIKMLKLKNKRNVS